MTLFVPVVRWQGKRYRTRLRLRRWGGFWRVRDDFPEGQVYRTCLGFVMVVTMVDTGRR